MSAKNVRVVVEVPDEVPEDAREAALCSAREAVVFSLLSKGAISIGRAAEELDLPSHDILELMTQRGIPVVRGPLDPDALAKARQELSGGTA